MKTLTKNPIRWAVALGTVTWIFRMIFHLVYITCNELLQGG